MATIILASGSPRRRQLLEQIGVRNFQVCPADADESYDPSLTPQEIVSCICRKKAEAASLAHKDPQAILITADTMVFLDGLRLGKPKDEADAFSMLRSLSGREHTVCTGVTVCQGEHWVTETETTKVCFRPLSDEEIRAYIRTGDPMDKAGAYGIQGLAALFITGIHGDFFNVMGLPVQRLGSMLRRFGVELLGGTEL